ncbi:MAG: hypothetical protein PWQ29_196 [Verrucomicrobiota bacterium]|jgi:hypothetical protein|nr:hypothetical protein [Verrucomicrobiota bacterium]
MLWMERREPYPSEFLLSGYIQNAVFKFGTCDEF